MKKRIISFVKAFVKLFVVMFVSYGVIIILISIIYDLITHYKFQIYKSVVNLNWISYLMFSLIWSLLSANKYSIRNVKIPSDYINESINNIKQYLLEKRWTIKKEDNCEIIFNAPKLELFFTEKIIVNIFANEISLTGSKYYLDTMVEKIDNLDSINTRT